MDLIDRYVHEVGEQLPERMREDVETELRSLLMDAVEARARESSRPVDSEIVTRVLREFGRPQEVARRYAPEAEYLIGPRLFPAYKRALTLVVIIFASLFLASVVLGILKTVQNPDSGFTPAPLFGGTWDLLKSLLFNFALMTIVFAIAERVRMRQEAAGKEWDPTKLLAIAKSERIPLIGGVIQIYMLIIFAALFNFYPQWVGVLVVYHGIAVHSILLPEFARYIPMLNVLFAASLAYNVWTLRVGRRTSATRWAELGLGLLGAGMLAIIITGPPVFIADKTIKQLLTLCLLLNLFVAVKRLYRILTRRDPEPWKSAGAQIL